MCTLICLTPELVWSTSLYQLNTSLCTITQQEQASTCAELLPQIYATWRTTYVEVLVTYIITKTWFPHLILFKISQQPTMISSFILSKVRNPKTRNLQPFLKSLLCSKWNTDTFKYACQVDLTIGPSKADMDLYKNPEGMRNVGGKYWRREGYYQKVLPVSFDLHICGGPCDFIL